MHYTATEVKPIAMQKRQRAQEICVMFTHHTNQVLEYVRAQRKKITYALICRCAKSLKISRAQVCDSLASLGMR